MIQTYIHPHLKKPNRKYLRILAQKVWDSYKKNKCIVSINFVDSKTMIDIHEQYLQDKSNTDVITFNLGIGPDGKEIADIYICTEVAETNAAMFNCSYEDEVARLVVHSMLHFVGYTDETHEKRQQMHQLENHFLKQFPLNS
ncbi:MAG: rRNA maturation RNase YbeY [Deferribacteres bacterium]|nr:rRNA maturation RNase YbeY [candidate division KSB1 bacterium]MCB9502997.1 rRNA maturation RNase YbeY [Deferribacteres bacterium]